MTTTVQKLARPARGREGQGEDPTSRPLPSPPKVRRRWGLFAAMVALVCLGALGNVWLHQATTNAQQVVAARSTIVRGTVIGRDKLMTVQIGSDPALRTVPGSQIEAMVGKRAAVDIAAGALLTPDAATLANIPSQGHSLVGVGVLSAMMPGTRLVAGDRIRVVAAPLQQGDGSAAPTSVAGIVVSIATGTDMTGQGAQSVITVDVPTGDAAQLAVMAGTGKVAIVLDSRDR